MKLSTLSALLQGDIKNALISEMPGGIEAQEAQGQQDFVASETLPIECNFCKREQLEAMGIVFGEEIDDLFIEARLPEGWEKAPTDHSMWSKLIDEQGRERAAIFYKAAFYDRSAHISLTRRFSTTIEPVCGWEEENYQAYPWHCVVKDAGEIVWQSEEQLGVEPSYTRSDEEGRKVWLDWHDRKRDMHKLGEAWLDENWPEWRDPLAYWGEAKAKRAE